MTPIPPQISEAFAEGRAALEWIVLLHCHDHLSPGRAVRTATLWQKRQAELAEERERARRPE